ncbi:MAG: hypothetical protein WC620_07765 [Methanoregula sp.]
MRQNAIYSPGDIGSSKIPRMLTTAPATPQMRIKPKSPDPKMTSTCLPPGGKIKATLPEITHVDSVGPEPGVGYGWSPECKDQHTKINRSGMIARFAACGTSRSGRFPCS